MNKEKLKRYLYLTLKIILGLLFLAAGFGKFLGAEIWIQKFTHWGFPAGMHLFIGVVEIAAAVLLFVPATFPYATLVLLGIMIGAVGTHLVNQEYSEIIRPLIFIIMLAPFLRSIKGKVAGKL